MSSDQAGIFYRLFFNPIVVRELRVLGRSWRVLIALSVALLAQGITMVSIAASNARRDGFSDIGEVGSWMFLAQAIVMVVLASVIFPAFSCTAIVSERERKSLDMLLLSPLEAWELIFGKLMSSLSLSLVFLVTGIPFMAIAYTYGSASIWWVISVMLTVFVLSIGVSAVGIYSSVVFKRILPSLVSTYILAQGLGTLAVFFVVAAFLQNRGSGGGRFLDVIQFLTPFQRVAIVGTVVVVMGLYLWLFLTMTISRMQAPSENRYRGVRILTLVALPICIGLASAGIDLASLVQTPYTPIVIGVALVIFFSVIASAAIKSSGALAFAPRGVAREIADRRAASPWKGIWAWMTSPGTLPAIAVGGGSVVVVVVSLTIVASSYISSMVLGPGLHAGDLSTSMDAVMGVSTLRRHFFDFQGLFVVNAPELAAYRDIVAELFSSILWRMAGVVLAALAVFSICGWWLSLRFKREHVGGILAVTAFVVLCWLPMIVGYMNNTFREIGVQDFSPVELVRNEASVAVLNALDEGARRFKVEESQQWFLESETLEDYRDRVQMGRIRGWAVFGILGAVFVLLLIPARRRALLILASNGRRWPPPVLPEERQFHGSRQTLLTSEPLVQSEADLKVVDSAQEDPRA